MAKHVDGDYKIRCQSCNYVRYHGYQTAMHKAGKHAKLRRHVLYVLDKAGQPVERIEYKVPDNIPDEPPF